MSSLTRKRCLITGASSGIGKATALAFAQQDSFDLVLLGRSRSKLDRVAEEVNRLDTAIYALDFAEVDQILPRMKRIEQETGSWDILVNCAGMGYTGTIAETPLQDWQAILNLNLTSVFQCVQAVLPGMRQRRSGHIINVASVAAQQVFPQWGA